ncbi:MULTISPECIES: ABC1 kinase family protein [unclassified Roseofilum]|uniref:ABC1 kinase family protein n=1 Tax=unclassified Roseofilum TaxID=2620099 RepID=UPI000E7FD2D4|nr:MULTISPECIES: AarF/UbiB family protein [unclassified Roseofilum]MBP0011131.1 AarF/ABC1/UbiB kinase family protein [Roseofilum sp. Belize Diploria]MBP0034666.1 AarF/ABC1/UbiB kinase family protein [Roseofilum sp. Belize BBD 4]HBQ96986.1 protein kinase [Cyanobacteria bacterium UBA11691]
MVNKKDIPTPLITGKSRKKVKVLDLEQLESRRVSLFYIIKQFVTFFLQVQLRKRAGKSDIQKTAEQLREIFEDLGGFWVKTGQLLALRSDLFPEEICDELTRLQFEAVGFPTSIVRSTIESELGVPLEQIFDDFDPEPLAAASIAQIHTAVLRGKKTRVAVKVQRPGLDESFRRDLGLIKIVARLYSKTDLGSFLLLDEAVAELERVLNEELDYRYEASNARRMKKTLKEHKIEVPKIYDKYTRTKVLVMEYIPGVLMADYIKVYQTDPARFRQWEEENKVDRETIGEKLYLSLYRQIFEDNLYHADLHPGNIILLRDNKLVLIDMGSVGSLDSDLRLYYLNYVKALEKRDFAKASDYNIRIGLDIPKANMPRVRAEMAKATEQWAAKSALKGVSYKEKSLGGGTSEIAKVAIKYRIPSNWSFLKITRSLLTLDGSMQYLIDDFDTLKIIKKYNKQSDRRALKRSLEPDNIIASINEFFQAIDEYNQILLPYLRQRTHAFEITVDKFALAIVVVLRTFSSVLLVSEVIVLYTFLYQNHFQWIKDIHTEVVNDMVSDIPVLPYLLWIFILIGILLAARILTSVATILERKEYGERLI